MEFLDGLTLKHQIAGKPMGIETVLDLGIEIADERTAEARGEVEAGANTEEAHKESMIHA